MESLSHEAVRKAVRFFMTIVEKDMVKKRNDAELFESFDDPEVSDVLGIFEEEAGIMLLRSGDTVYYTPKTDNRFFGFSNEELRKSMNFSNNTELYTAYVIMLSILIKFYNGENYNVKCRTILKVEELERFVTNKLAAFLERDESEQEAIGFNFSSVTKFWMEMPAYDEKIISFSRSSGTRISYIYKTLGFMKEQGLLNVANDSEIFATEKLDIMATAYYPESTRKRELLSYIDLLSEGGKV